MSHTMIVVAIATTTRAERKGAQLDSSIMDFMAISDPGDEHRARCTANCDGESQRTLIQRKTIGSAVLFSTATSLMLSKDAAQEFSKAEIVMIPMVAKASERPPCGRKRGLV